MCLATYATTYYFQKLRNKRDVVQAKLNQEEAARKKEIHTLQVLALKRDAE
jgi:hypothetical protein